MNKTTRITIEDLALMVKKGFDSVDRRFNILEHQFKDMRMYMDQRFDRLEAKMDNVENTVFKDHAPRIRRVEKKLEIA